MPPDAGLSYGLADAPNRPEGLTMNSDLRRRTDDLTAKLAQLRGSL